MDYEKIIMNIEGLRNPTILQSLEALRQYVVENAVKGDTGPIGIYTTTSPYVDTTTQYPIALIKGYTPTSDNAELVGRIIYFASDGKTAIVNGVGVSTPSGAQVFSVSNVKDITGPQGPQGETGAQGATGQTGRGIELITADPPSPDPSGLYTVTPLTITMSSGADENVEVYAAIGEQGPRGLTGNGITAIASGASYVAGDETITPITVTYSDATTQDLAIHAKNGADGGITVDDALSLSSINPVQNKVVTEAIHEATKYNHAISIILQDSGITYIAIFQIQSPKATPFSTSFQLIGALTDNLSQSASYYLPISIYPSQSNTLVGSAYMKINKTPTSNSMYIYITLYIESGPVSKTFQITTQQIMDIIY